MGSGHINPGSWRTAPDGDAIPAQPASPAPTHAERARKLLASQTRGRCQPSPSSRRGRRRLHPSAISEPTKRLRWPFTEPI